MTTLMPQHANVAATPPPLASHQASHPQLSRASSPHPQYHRSRVVRRHAAPHPRARRLMPIAATRLRRAARPSCARTAKAVMPAALGSAGCISSATSQPDQQFRFATPPPPAPPATRPPCCALPDQPLCCQRHGSTPRHSLTVAGGERAYLPTARPAHHRLPRPPGGKPAAATRYADRTACSCRMLRARRPAGRRLPARCTQHAWCGPVMERFTATW